MSGQRLEGVVESHDTRELDLRFVEHVLSGVTGETPTETQLLRASWIRRNLPRTASLIGVDGEPA